MWLLSNDNKGYPKRLITGFLFVALVASAVSSVLLMDRFRSYRADIDMLILSKSAKGAAEVEAARDALILFGSRTDFLYSVNEQADVTGIVLKETGKGSLRVSVSSLSPIDARDGVVAASQELFLLAGKYYDVRNDIDVRSIGAPRTEASIAHPILLALSGVVSGVGFAVIFFLSLLSFARIAFSFRKEEETLSPEQVFFPKPKEAQSNREKEEVIHAFSPDTFVPKKIDTKFFSFEPSGVEREKDYAHFNRGPAPTNLPVAWDESEPLPDFLFSQSALGGTVLTESSETKGENVVTESDAIDDALMADTPIELLSNDREPTVEEYKQRLNDLLKGKMPR